MEGETDLTTLLKTMHPRHNAGEYVFCTISDIGAINMAAAAMLFREQEGYTIILERSMADQLQLAYPFVASWITLTVHSSLSAKGFTAAFSAALAAAEISCNVVAAYHHDHVFVPVTDTARAMQVLRSFAAG